MQEEDIKKPEPQNNDESASLEGKFAELEKKCDEYLNNWKRATADFINYKKEEMQRVAMLSEYVKENTILKILPIFDSFYLAEKHTNKLENVDMTEWMKGFEQIKKQIEDFLKKEGVEEVKAVGEKFNPETMEIVAASAVGRTESASGETKSAESSGEPKEEVIVVEELQKGYKMGDKVLRPAKVRVNK